MSKTFNEEAYEPLLATLARMFARQGAAKEVAVLAYGQADFSWNHEDYHVNFWTLYLQIPSHLFEQIRNEKQDIEGKILAAIAELMQPYDDDEVSYVAISPLLEASDDWREKARAWVEGKGVNNQGRVRSDNVAPIEKDGLLFRSQPEVNLYLALKAGGVSFAPLPVFVRGGEIYRRIEPDFVIVKDGITIVVEVDGDTVHAETPAEAHDRTTMLAHEGVHIERVPATACDSREKADKLAVRLMGTIAKLKSNR